MLPNSHDVDSGDRRRRWIGALLVLLVLVTGAVVSAAAYRAVLAGEQQYAAQVMDRYADQLSAAVTDHVGRNGQILSDLSFSVGAQTDLSRDDFARITAGMTSDRLLGAAGVAYVVPATTAGTPAVQRWWRRHGFTDLTLRPAPGTDEHEFVIAERVFDDTDAHGVDLQASPQAAAALRVARQSGELAVSPAYQLLRDSALPAAQQQSSVLLAAPVVAGLGSHSPDRFTGWVVMGLRGQDFLARTLTDTANGAVHVSLADSTGTPIAAITVGTGLDDDTLVRHRSVPVGQQRWDLSVSPTTQLAATADRGLSRLTLIAGAALTVMLTLMIAVLAGSRNRALEQVERATHALREDITRREQIEAQLRQREEQLHHQAMHDPLTGLANRTLFHDRLDQALTGDSDPSDTAVLFVDLDGFKQINDQYGHDAGDTVLRAVADRLRTSVRAGDTVARFGGDEFALLLHPAGAPDNPPAVAQRLITAVQQPIDADGTLVTVGASIGIATAHPGAAADTVLRNADTAMYAAKTRGKNRYAQSMG